MSENMQPSLTRRGYRGKFMLKILEKSFRIHKTELLYGKNVRVRIPMLSG